MRKRKSLKEMSVLQTKSLLVSAGHSNKDPGAVGNGYTEADIVLDLRDNLKEALLLRGVVARTDGGADQNLPLSEAIKIAREVDIALEFHCNSFHKPSATGVETLCHASHGSLAGKVANAISKAIGLFNRGVKGESSGQHSRLGFISRGGGIIVELFFLSNPNDLQAYMDNKEAVVDAIADVLVEAVTEDYPDDVDYWRGL